MIKARRVWSCFTLALAGEQSRSSVGRHHAVCVGLAASESSRVLGGETYRLRFIRHDVLAPPPRERAAWFS